MTTQFRLDAVALDTTEGQVHYELLSDLTVLAGPTAVGKTTLLELIKYGFGGDGQLAPVARQHIHDVTLSVTVGESRLRISRSIDPDKRKTVRVIDLITQERLPDHHLDDAKPSLNTLLMGALGLPDDMRAAARSGGSSKAGARITFNDVFSFLYVAQAEINRDIAHSQDSYRDPKRRAVFELLFGLTSADILAMRSKVNTLKGEITDAEREYKTVLAFLRDSHTADRQQTEAELSAAIAAQEEAAAERAALREAIDPVIDRETQVVRDLLTDAERGLAEARSVVSALARQQGEYTSERNRLRADLAKLDRMRDAGERLANIEFAVCPRCMQNLTRHVPGGHCRVCLQPDPIDGATASDTDTYEIRQLTDQLAEVDDQLDVIAEQLTATTDAITHRERLVEDLTTRIDSRTVERITPRLQAFSDATERLATARAQQQRLEHDMLQWDRAEDLRAAAERLNTERSRLQTTLKTAEEDLDSRRREILANISEEFQHTVTMLNIPGIESAEIHPTTYLPLLNGQPFSTVSRAGGIITATQVAYWISLLTIALRRRDTLYPAFLLIDTPRLALHTAEALSAALYRRLVTQADANVGELQLVIADNELPAEYTGEYSEIDFSYQNPTVPTIPHPGPNAVETIGNDVNGDDAGGRS